jgi:hypothetical protein
MMTGCLTALARHARSPGQMPGIQVCPDLTTARARPILYGPRAAGVEAKAISPGRDASAEFKRALDGNAVTGGLIYAVEPRRLRSA